MADHTKVVVYLRAKDVRMLREAGIEDSAMWTRATVKDALAAQREALKIKGVAYGGIPADYADSAE
jgi:hypothetical protein